MAQWQKSGINISSRPEILATLFNIGFIHSKPNNNAEVGGAELQIGDSTYSFGRLSYEFYYSGELLDEFPQSLQNNKTANNTPLQPSQNKIATSNLPASLISAKDILNWAQWLIFFNTTVK